MTFNIPVESSSSVTNIGIEYLHEYQSPIHQPKAKVEKIFDGLGDAIEEENTALVLKYVFEEFTFCQLRTSKCGKPNHRLFGATNMGRNTSLQTY